MSLPPIMNGPIGSKESIGFASQTLGSHLHFPVEWNGRQICLMNPQQMQRTDVLAYDVFSERRVYFNEESPFWTYVGSYRGIEMSGNGALLYKDGSFYKGQMNRNLPNGYGAKILSQGVWFQRGSYYEGDFVDGRLEGLGFIVFNMAPFYERPFLHESCSYRGGWLNNMPHGVGSLKMMGDRYEGRMVEGYCSGYGVMHFRNGVIYDGEWIQGLPHGKGKRMTPNPFSNNLSYTIEKGRFVRGKFLSINIPESEYSALHYQDNTE